MTDRPANWRMPTRKQMEPGKGTGPGLAEVKRFVERSGGMIAAESAENVGTTVRMFFPCD